MDELMLFTDGSVNVQSKVGYGAYLVVAEHGLPHELLRKNVKLRRFENTSSTKLELQTLLWALEDIQAIGHKVIAYTDSQNIIGLQGRRHRLESNNFYSKNNKRLNNFELYQEFYRMTDQLDCQLVKVRGHSSSSQKNDIEKIFTLVDRATRNELRKESN